MTYEEKGRGIFGLNGRNVMLDPDGVLWLLSEHTPVKVDVSQWNEYVVIARGNHLQHFINGQPTSELIDHHADKRALEGLLAIQLHKGNTNRVEIKDLRLKVLPDAPLVPFDAEKLPATATKIEKPRTSRPQGTGPVVPICCLFTMSHALLTSSSGPCRCRGTKQLIKSQSAISAARSFSMPLFWR
jgi:hypothetical protein